MLTEMACLKSRIFLLFSLSVLSFLSFAADAKSVRGIGFRPETEAPVPDTEAPKPETEAPVPATEAPEPVLNLAEIIGGDEDLSILVEVVKLGGLGEAISMPGAFTVFAPTNVAFMQTLASLGGLESVSPELVRSILAYHVVPGVVMASDIENGGISPTLLPGATIQFSVADDVVTVNGAVISTTDIVASNGVVHKIDGVLIPPLGPPEEPAEEPATEDPVEDPAEEPAEEPATEVPEEPEDAMNLLEAASLDPMLAILVNVVKATGLESIVTTTGPFTVFAPTNAAFLEVLGKTEDIASIDPQILLTILSYHVVPGIVMIDSIKDGDILSTVMGETIEFHVKDDVVTVNEKIISTSDIVTSNGVIHKIDGVMFPQAVLAPAESPEEPATEVPEEPATEVPEEPEDAMNLLEVAALDPDLAFLVNVVKATGLESIVTTTGPFTVFAPTNAAFLEVLGKTEDIASIDPQILLTILSYHVVPGNVMIGSINNGDILPTVMGETIEFHVKDDGVVTVNEKIISTSDIVTSNGVIHKIDGVMFPQIVLAPEQP